MYTTVAAYAVLSAIIASASIWKPRSPDPEVYRHSPPTKRERLWDTLEINPRHVFRVDKAIALYLDTKPRYEKIQNMRKTGVPAAIIFCLHGRESTWSFSRHLHEGSSLRRRTRYVPKGRPIRGKPPFTFEASAEDALYVLKDLENKDWTTVDNASDLMERYNGLGYRLYHKDVNTPYNYAGSNQYTRGKYVADGSYDRYAVDKQLGCCTILKRMQGRGIDIGFR